ncbi:MAG TPA: NUDIX domain-containing protein [Candidatus Bathyarchaeia archaeon]|nr:NUDIX domain-containing protein [Candidatus Bathyarchaeia archaeon]
MTPRHCLACGARLRVGSEHGFPRWRCARCGWIFYNNPVPATVAIVTGPRGVLLCRRAAAPFRGTWDLAGGFLEAGERPEHGLRREVREELGARVRRARLVGFLLDQYGAGGVPILGLIYRVQVTGRIRARSDVSEVRWFRPDAIPWRRIGFVSIRRALRAHLPPARRRRG